MDNSALRYFAGEQSIAALPISHLAPEEEVMIREKMEAPPDIPQDITDRKPITKAQLMDRLKFFSKALFDLPYRYKADFVKNKVTKGSYASFRAPKSVEEINEDLEVSILVFVGMKNAETLFFDDTLIHELLHYYLWHLGLGYSDTSPDFYLRARQLGVSRNDDHVWNSDTKSWECSQINYEKLQYYEDAYQEYLKTGSIPDISGPWRAVKVSDPQAQDEGAWTKI